MLMTVARLTPAPCCPSRTVSPLLQGAVDLDAIADETQRAAVRDQIGHFGQTPAQLFRRKHIKRGPPPLPSLNPLLNAPESMIPSAVRRARPSPPPPVLRPGC